MSCVNHDKGAVSMKACKVSCIGCGKCEKECNFGAITVENNVAYIDFEKCRLCRKCVTVCPRHAILDVNFPSPAPAPKPKEPATTKTEIPKSVEKPVEKPAEKPTEKEKPEPPKAKVPKPSRGAMLDTDSSISIK